MVPGFLLAKFALDQSRQGSGQGGELLWDALARVLQSAAGVAARVVIVDAERDDVMNFSKHYGLLEVRSSTRRMVMALNKVQKTMDGL